MARTVIGLFDEYGPAENALIELLAAGFEEDRISILAAAGSLTRLDAEHLEGGAQLVKDLVALSVPDLGTIVMSGPLERAVRSRMADGLPPVLLDMGVSAEDAGYYAEGVRRGGILLAVTVENSRAGEAADIVALRQPVDLEQRSAQWRHAGYTPWPGERKLHQDHPDHPGERTTHHPEMEPRPHRGVRVYSFGENRGDQ
jgi:hypothetical protein